MFSSMQGKPVLSAGRAAKDSAPVIRLGDFHKGVAVPAVERMAYGLGFDVFRMFPVQPFAVGRAKLRPPIRRFSDSYQTSAFDAAEGAQRFLLAVGPHVVVVAMAVGILPAKGTAVLLRRPIGHKLRAAYGTNGIALHGKSRLCSVLYCLAVSPLLE